MSSAAPEPRTRPPGADLQLLVPLRPQGPVEVLDRATLVLRNRFTDLMSVSLLVQLPIWLVLALLLRDDWATGLGDNAAWFWLAIFPDPVTVLLLVEEATQVGWVAMVLARALPSLGLALLGGTYGILVLDWAHGRPTRGPQALARALRRGHVLVALWALVHAVQFVTCVGVVLGPLVFGVAAPLCAMEGTGPVEGLRRSWKLSLKRFWHLCLSIPIATLVAGLTAMVLGGIGFGILAGATEGWVDLGGTATVALGGVLPRLIMDPLLAVCMALLALDLKVQVEGYDLEVELADTAGGAGAR